MKLAGMLLGFLDELEKVSAFNTVGLSPETVLEKSQPPPPMETPGFEKARNILDRAAQMKTAAVDVKFRQGGALTKPKDDSSAESAKSVGGYALAGGGAGKMLADFTHGATIGNPQKFRKVVHKGTGIGIAAGAAYGVHRAIQRKKAKQATIVKTATISTPALALKSAKQVGKIKTAPSVAGPSINTQIRGQLIGKKGTP